MPGALISSKDQEAVINGLIEQGAAVRETKRGFMIGFPNGESGVISFQGDHRRLKNARALVRRQKLRWPLDPTDTDTETDTTEETATVPQFKTEFAPYLKGKPDAQTQATVDLQLRSLKDVTIPALKQATGYSTNTLTKALINSGFLQEAIAPGTNPRALRRWRKAPDEVLARVSFGEVLIQEEKEDRWQNHPDGAPALPPFTPLAESTAERRERIRREQPEDLNGPVIVTTVEERDRILAETPDAFEGAAEVIVTGEEPDYPGQVPAFGERIEPNTPDESEAEGWMAEAERLESRALAAESEVERIRGSLADAQSVIDTNHAKRVTAEQALEDAQREADERGTRIETLTQQVTDAERQRDTAAIELVAVAEARDIAVRLNAEAITEIDALRRGLQEETEARLAAEARVETIAREAEAALANIPEPVVIEAETWAADDTFLEEFPEVARLVAAVGLEIRFGRAR